MVGICFSTFGFITYYVVPFSFLIKDVGLFLLLLLSVLFFMIIGMTFIA